MNMPAPSGARAATTAAYRKALIAELQDEIDHATIYYSNVELERLRDVMRAVNRRPAPQDVR